MKTTPLLLSLAILSIPAAFAETPAENPPAANSPPPIRTLPASSPGDGFFLRGADAYMVRNGVTTKMDHEVVFANGLRVLPDGKVTLPTGTASTLRGDRLLSFDGGFMEVPYLPQAAALPQNPAEAKAAKRDVGASSRDGITVSGADVFITRNGITDKVTTDMKLPNGVIAKPDGSVVMSDGHRITLRVDQLLDLNGVLHEAPVRPSAPGPDPSSSTTQGN